jgi:hypothetical protein
VTRLLRLPARALKTAWLWLFADARRELRRPPDSTEELHREDR